MVFQTGFLVVIECENEYNVVLDLLGGVDADPDQARDAGIAQVFLRNIPPAQKVHFGPCPVLLPAVFQHIENVTFRNVALRATLLSMIRETHMRVDDVRLLCSIGCRDGMRLLRCAFGSSHCRGSTISHKPGRYELCELFMNIVLGRGMPRASRGQRLAESAGRVSAARGELGE